MKRVSLFSRLSLVGRVVVLASAVAMVVVLVVAAALIAIISLRRAEARESRAKDVTTATLRVENIAFDLESSSRGYTLTGDRRFITLFYAARTGMPVAVGRLKKLVADDPEQFRRAREAEGLMRRYVTDYALPLIAIRTAFPEIARVQTATDEDRRRATEIRDTLGNILAVEQQRSAARSRQAREVAQYAVIVGSVALALSAGLVLLFGAWVARGVAAPVRRASSAAAQVAAGDFDVRLDESGAGEVGALLSAFNSMARALELGRRELLEQNERLRESEQHKRDLISMVSHEIRTPLASVVGFTSLLLEREFPSDEQRRYLEIVDQQARRLAGLAGDFLDVQLLEGGGLSFDYAPFDLVDLASEQVRLFFSHADDHTIDLDVPDEPVIVNADRDRIAQVIGNLLSNAIKYSPSGGRVRLLLTANERNAQLSVVDEGMGIPVADRARIFEKFFRGPGAAAAIGGTGLGLAVAREIVTSHGGRIEVESEPGQGSTFTVRLPRVSAPVSA
jgi:signal transduction histidine kinase